MSMTVGRHDGDEAQRWGGATAARRIWSGSSRRERRRGRGVGEVGNTAVTVVKTG